MTGHIGRILCRGGVSTGSTYPTEKTKAVKAQTVRTERTSEDFSCCRYARASHQVDAWYALRKQRYMINRGLCKHSIDNMVNMQSVPSIECTDCIRTATVVQSGYRECKHAELCLTEMVVALHEPSGRLKAHLAGWWDWRDWGVGEVIGRRIQYACVDAQ